MAAALGLVDLPDDELLIILVPFCVSKHGVLMSVCRRFHGLLTSDAFLQMRRRLGHAQHVIFVLGGSCCSSGQRNWARMCLMPKALCDKHKWRALASYPGLKVDDFATVRLADEDFYFGGRANLNCSAWPDVEHKVYAYSWTRDAWRVVSHSPLEIGGILCMSIDGKVILAGGTEHHWTAAAQAGAWLFDPTVVCFESEEHILHSLDEWVQGERQPKSAAYWAARGWTQLPDMPYAVTSAWRSFVSDRRLYVVGGYGDDGTSWAELRRLMERKTAMNASRERLRRRQTTRPLEEQEALDDEYLEIKYAQDDWDERENREVKWIQEFDLDSMQWRVLDMIPDSTEGAAPSSLMLEKPRFEYKPAIIEQLYQLGLGNGQTIGTGVYDALPYEMGTLVVGDGAGMAFVDKDGAVSKFEPQPQDFGSTMLLECPYLERMELRANHVHVRCVAQLRA
tara:strand:- start:972 stop:2327 length:1356 start_codon:yes stop_codon:yes gene_type:complete